LLQEGEGYRLFSTSFEQFVGKKRGIEVTPPESKRWFPFLRPALRRRR
jgi:hypothetical protein